MSGHPGRWLALPMLDPDDPGFLGNHEKLHRAAVARADKEHGKRLLAELNKEPSK